MDIITFITAAILLSSSSAIPPASSSAIPPASSPAIPPAGRDERTQPLIAPCVMLIFNPPPEPQPKMKILQCRDRLRTIALINKITGSLSPEYVEALEKLPKFKKNPSLLHKYLRSLSE